ncbi:RNA polymerase I-specific transcription initiation factor RRN3 [Lactarius akahatsu]|uniref:RNA polymerase I-specific transcription initiation factor RRN3 n=1 Tax=Lactarius akahatsu TaxID=416441 RepID=A0AAD4LCE3_9AGAM|nr:RNA polymerase I-specific transcription initiation factor RRN3 [Lactarius akahatsu]
MDPHSRLTQFNQRSPKALNSRQMDSLFHPKSPILDRFAKRSDASGSNSSKGRKRSSSVLLDGSSRPIATNSRIKQDERFRKDMHLAFVHNALQQKALGNREPYDSLVNQFNVKKSALDAPSPSPIPQLRLWLQALMHVVSRLDRTHIALIEAIARLPWMTMDSSLVKTYTSFIEILVSARPEYLSLVLGRITLGFTYQSGLQALEAGLPECSVAPLTRRRVYDRIHYLLRHLLALVPTLPSTLRPFLVQNFPHKRQSQASQITYIRNMLRITQYCPEMADGLLSTIIDRAIQIDVEIQVELEELEAVQEQAEVFDFDPFDTVVGQEPPNDPGEDEDDDGSDDGGDNFSDLSTEAGSQDNDDAPLIHTPVDLDRITEMANKLDDILKLLFDHFNRPPSSTPISASPSEPSTPAHGPSPPLSPLLSSPRTPSPPAEPKDDPTSQLAQFHTLLAIFTRTILCTFKSRYTQFLLFWFASRDATFADLFLGELVAHALLEPSAPVVSRAAAASYVASFVSRAMFIGRDEARGTVRVLCRFLENEAVFLIFCFRWRELVEGDDEGEPDALAGSPKKMWMAELSVVQRVVACPLQPLKFCSENVARQFARVAHATGFMYVFPLLAASPAQQQQPLPVPTHPNALSELTSFFPFDPYKLPRSSSYIEPIYREWTSVAVGVDDDDDSDEEEEEEDGADLDVRAEADGLGASFEEMKISPVPALAHGPTAALGISSIVG